MDTSRRSFIAAALATAGRALAGGALAPGPTRRTGWFHDPAMLDYTYGPDHPESPARLEAVVDALESAGLTERLERVAPLADPLPHVRAVHSTGHLDGLVRADAAGYRAAIVAVAGALGAADAVCRGQITNAFCALRPPGHHAANAGKPHGYCYVNHVVVAARFCLRVHGVERVLIADWDYHHGDGTQALTADTPGIVYFSTHNRRAFPGTGRSRSGGRALNLHLGPGSDDGDIVGAWERHLPPAAAALRPGMVLLSAGFDGLAGDPQGRWRLTAEGYGRLTRVATAIAEEHCGGRLVSILEGGYNVQAIGAGAAAHVRALLGVT